MDGGLAHPGSPPSPTPDITSSLPRLLRPSSSPILPLAAASSPSSRALSTSSRPASAPTKL